MQLKYFKTKDKVDSGVYGPFNEESDAETYYLTNWEEDFDLKN
jgi:hypothetical protein